MSDLDAAIRGLRGFRAGLVADLASIQGKIDALDAFVASMGYTIDGEPEPEPASTGSAA